MTTHLEREFFKEMQQVYAEQSPVLTEQKARAAACELAYGVDFDDVSIDALDALIAACQTSVQERLMVGQMNEPF